MTLNRVLLFLLLTSSQFCYSQVNRYMVFFKDKSGGSFTTTNPSLYLSTRAIERRIKQNISISELDLPVNDDYVQALRTAGAGVFYKTRWMNGVLVQCDASLLATLDDFSFVKSIELVAPKPKLTNGRTHSVSQRKEDVVSGTSETSAQLQMLGIDQMHSDGYHGEGVTIAVFDAGFPGVNTTTPFQLLMNENRVDLTVSHDFVYNTSNVFRYDSHGTQVLSTIAAYQESVFTGGAYKANIQLYVTEDIANEYRIEEYNWLFAAERADSAGVDIISSSLGYTDFDDASMDYSKSDLDGKTAVVTRAAQLASERGILVICSAGNEGANAWGTITPPADAPGVLAIANVSLQGMRSSTSSVGPSSDGRTKPDLSALGTSVSVIMGSGAHGTVSGTSLAAPLITALMAGLWQHYPELTNAQLMEVVKNTASMSASPNNFVGYGIPNYKAVANFFNFVPQEKTFEVYPNPVVDSLMIRPKSPEEITSCTMEVITSLGQRLVETNIEFNWLNRTHSFVWPTTLPGVYFVRLRLNEKSYVFKIVKQ